MGVQDAVTSKLAEVPAGTSLALQVSIPVYLDVIKGIIDNYASRSRVSVIYVTSSIPSRSILSAFEVLEINSDHVSFVDCVTHTMVSAVEKGRNIFLVESPTMLENLMLKVEFLTRKLSGGKVLVLLDSLNSLCIHNSPGIVSEFLHILVNNLRAKGVPSVILMVQEHGTEEVKNMLNVCDEMMVLDEGTAK
jgi:KaiC/GvpD/RAD55 family RecA-like ATPase